MGWPKSVVSFIDLPGIKRLSEGEGREGSTLMRALHQLVAREVSGSAYGHLDQVYMWNDSVLLLGYVNADHTQADILRDADKLKRCIDAGLTTETADRSYAVAVQGLTFPEPVGDIRSGRVALLKTSSYAMGNCFLVEKAAARRKLRYGWYVDERLLAAIPKLSPRERFTMEFMPRNRRRDVGCFDGYLTPSGSNG